jgi:drug/metabolite transporter (DMT)-like permease
MQEKPSPQTTIDRRAGILLVLLAAVLWSSGGLFIKWVSVDVFTITVWRSALAAVTIVAFLRPHPRLVFSRSPLTLGLAGSYAAMLLLFVAATRNTTAANAIFLQYTAPLYVLILGGRLLGERPSRLDTVATLNAFAGMGLFFVGRFDPNALLGNVMAIGSGASLAIFFILLRMPGCTPATRPAAMVLGNVVLVVLVLPLAAWRESSSLITPGWGDAAALAFLGIVQIGIAYIIFGKGIAHVSALEASLVGMLEPVLNPLWVLLVIGEKPGWWAAAGGLVIILVVGVRTVLSERTSSRSYPTRSVVPVSADP